MICDSWWGFEVSQLSLLLSWALSRQDKKIKIHGIMNRSVTFIQYDVIFTLWTLKYVDYVPFSCIDSFYVVHNQTN